MTHPHTIDQRAHELYQQSCMATPSTAKRRLHQARQRALTQARRPRRRPLWLPAGAMAATALALVVGWQQFPVHAPSTTPPAPQNTASQPEDAPADMYRDLDFYIWLANRTEPAPSRS